MIHFFKKICWFLRLVLIMHVLYMVNWAYSNNKSVFHVLQPTGVSSLKSDYQEISSDIVADSTNCEIITVTADINNSLVSTSTSIDSLNTKYIIDAADLLKNISGFSVIRYGGANNDFVFRGIPGSKMHILVDTGEIIGACLFRMDPATSYIAPGNFDILNFVKGPQTVLWGPVTSGGTIQFQRYHPRFDLSDVKMRSNFTIGSFNSIKRNIDTIFGNKYGYIRLIGNCDYSGDYRDANNHRVHSAWYKWNFDSNLSFNLKSNTYLIVNLGQGNGRANYATKAMDGLCFSRESYGLKIITSDIDDIISEIEFQIWNHHIHHIMMNNTIPVSMTSVTSTYNKHCCSVVSNINNVDRVLWGSRGMITYQWKDFKCFSGIDIQLNQHKKQKDCMSNAFYVDVFSTDSGIFTELIFDALLNKKIIGGIRLEYSMIDFFNNYGMKRYKNNLLYPAGFIRYENNISSSCLYYCGIGMCCRFPDYWELMSFESNECSKQTDSIFKLKPEKTIQIDVGTYFKKSRVTGWISSYAGYIKDFIYCHHNDNKNEVRSKNSIDYIHNVYVKIYGTEMGLSYQFNDYWYGESNISYPWGWNMNDRCVLPTISPLEGRLTLQFKQKKYIVGASWRLVSSSQRIMGISSLILPNTMLPKKCLNTSCYTPSFEVISMYMSWKASQYYTCNIGVDNLFNQNYKEYINVSNHYSISKNSNKLSVYEPGRTWWMNVEVAF
ncbi:outer membrane protein OprC [Candidatus Blochmanniella floridana]|uniref:Outer membrane protein OprC n=1 Tax=Blochmanniella floridana TaxID=203907 RepID=Q7VR34_BLOFL|nr:outer membrane protein OprC [Candidatus Blochmannia floridanus]